MRKVTVLGIDPSLNNFGLAKGDLCIDTGNFTLTNLKLSETSSDKVNKKTVRKNSDDLRRARIHYENLQKALEGVDLVMVEIPVGSQSARSMASYGICIGLLASLDSVIQVTPLEVKLAATGCKTASKQQMIDWATSTYPKANWLTKKTKGVTSFTNKNEHLADAVAAIHAGVKTDQFKQILNIWRKNQ